MHGNKPRMLNVAYFIICVSCLAYFGARLVFAGDPSGTVDYGAGCVDFTGAAVIHTVGGMLALTGAWILGPRINKFNPDGSSNAIPGHNLTLVVLGTLILAFGWFAFNAGSTLGATDLRISVIATNTFLGACAYVPPWACVYLNWLNSKVLTYIYTVLHVILLKRNLHLN